MSTTIAGNITADPQVRFTDNGTAVCNFTVASTPRRFDKAADAWVDGSTLFMRCTAWSTQAENIAETLGKGARVVVTGTLEQHDYQDSEGNQRTSIELAVDEVGCSLRFAPMSLPVGVTGTQSSGGDQRESATRQPGEVRRTTARPAQ